MPATAGNGQAKCRARIVDSLAPGPLGALPPAMPQALPRYTVAISSFNRPEHLAGLLASWRAVDYPREGFELVLIDDGSPEDYAAEVERQRGDLAVRLFRVPHRGASAGRRSALGQARAPYLIFTDDDCRPDRNCLRACDAATTRLPLAGWGGHVENLLLDNPYATASQWIVNYVTARWNQAGSAVFFSSSLLIFPTAELRRRNTLEFAWPKGAAGEDRELCERWCDSGGQLLPAPDVCTGHCHHLTLTSFWRQHHFYGRGKRELESRRPIGRRDTPRLSRPSFYRDLLLGPCRAFGLRRGIPIALLVLVAQLALFVGYLRYRPAAPSGGKHA